MKHALSNRKNLNGCVRALSNNQTMGQRKFLPGRKTRKSHCFIMVIAFILDFFLVSGLGFPQDEAANTKAPEGMIKGRVIDEEIKSPIPNVRVKVVGTSLEVYTDADGYFSIPNVSVGTYTLELSSRFFITRRKPDVIVKSNRTTYVEATLKLDKIVQEEEITVTASYFSSTESQPTSSTSFSNEEIRRAAGSAGDVSRIISSLPSVTRTNDMINYLVVRGGSPAENSFYLDNIEIPNINHYPALGSTAGAISLLNVDFIRDVRFYSGGFSPIFGDRLSSVMDISFREGNHDESDFQLSLDMMGIGAVGEGPVASGKGSWMFSARRSYIDLLIDLMGSGVPVTWSDFQGKLNFDLSSNNRLSFLGVAGLDSSGTKKEDALKDDESFYGDLDTTEYTVGVNWFSIWGTNGYSNTSLSHSYIRYKDAYYHTVSEELARRGKNREQSFVLRNVIFYRLSQASNLEFGFELKHLTSDYNYYLASYTDVLGTSVPDFSKEIKASAEKASAFLKHTWNPFSKLTLNTGIRVDYSSHNKNSSFSPRLSLSYTLSEKSSLDAEAGVFTQHLPLVLLFQNKNFKTLSNPLAYHFVLGIRHLLTENTRLTIEVYDKEYKHFPLDPAQPSLFIFDEVFYSGFFNEHSHLLDTGKARSYGIEFMIQKKLAEKVYGMMSASYFRSRYRDLDGVWHNRVYDNQYIFAVEGGYKLNKFWEFGVKWNYAGGPPYTPFDEVASQHINSGIFDLARINGERLPAYHSLNIRMDKRFYFRASNLTLYLSVWNVYNRKNVFSYYWNTIEKKPGHVLGWGILPVLGIEFEF